MAPSQPGSTKHVAFRGHMVMVGFGSIGQGVLPLLARHIDMHPAHLLVIAPAPGGAALAREYGAEHLAARLTRENYRDLLGPRLAAGDLLLNLSVDVSSVALMRWCRERGVLYLDTCTEPWAGGYTDAELPIEERTNHALRESALALRVDPRGGPTAVITHGANPGLVSHLVKQALLDIAAGSGRARDAPRDRAQWAALAAGLGVRAIHIAERDSQSSPRRKSADEFVNTWSVPGFVAEACQPAELGWGSHEKQFPPDGVRPRSGSPASIFLRRFGAATRARSWTPRAGAYHGFLVTHAEALSIADYFTVGEGERPAYRPTVHYAYHPCDDAVLSLHELAGRNWQLQSRRRVIKDEIDQGIDELGVLLMGHARGAYWYGSPLSMDQARELCPHNSATSLQVTAAVMAGVVWAIRHPDRGVVEPDEMPFDEVLPLCEPYLGGLVGVYSDWTPLVGRDAPFDDDLDRDDPWQFRNFRVA